MIALLLLATALGCGRHEGKTAARARPAQPSASQAARLTKAEGDGASKLRLAAQILEEHPVPLSAKVRQTVNVLGHEMRGAGDYWQMPQAAEGAVVTVLSRMELRLQIHDRTATWKQICDGKYLWTETKVPDEEKSLTRPDGEPGYSTRLDRVDLAEAAQAQVPSRGENRALAGALSGLPQLLRTLAGTFDFSPPQSIRIGDVNAWLLEGRWKPAVLGDLVPEQRPATALGEIDLGLLPPRIPDRVKVYLGQNRSGPWVGDLASRRVPPPDLFPFRIEYSRQAADSDEVSQVLNLEVYDVAFDDDTLRADKFTFKTGRKHHNATPRFVRALKRNAR